MQVSIWALPHSVAAKCVERQDLEIKESSSSW